MSQSPFSLLSYCQKALTKRCSVWGACQTPLQPPRQSSARHTSGHTALTWHTAPPSHSGFSRFPIRQAAARQRQAPAVQTVYGIPLTVPHQEEAAVFLGRQCLKNRPSDLPAPHFTMVERKPSRRFQPDILVGTVFHNPLAEHRDFWVILFHILPPFRHVSIAVTRQKQGIHQFVQQFIIIRILCNAFPRDRDTVVDPPLADCFLKLLQILRKLLFPDILVHPHQAVNRNPEKLRNVRKKLDIRIADIILLARYRLI